VHDVGRYDKNFHQCRAHICAQHGVVLAQGTSPPVGPFVAVFNVVVVSTFMASVGIVLVRVLVYSLFDSLTFVLPFLVVLLFGAGGVSVLVSVVLVRAWHVHCLTR